MIYKNLTLDPFQEESTNHIHHNHSVVVSAPTGSGKTIIADYIINKDLNKKKVIYTAPIKALSNQKFREFIHEFGMEHVGLITGDVVINPDVSVLIMTTEIYRNMVMENDPVIKDVNYVIFDEIHYLGDPERGTVWEEAIIFSPPHIRFLCLSATIPNADEFAQWIQQIKKHPVHVVKHDKRPVPLKHYVYDISLGITTIDNLSQVTDKYKITRRMRSMFKRPNHLDLLKTIVSSNEVPCIYFTFSRIDTQKKALQAGKKFDLLKPHERAHVVHEVSEKLSKYDPQIIRMETTKQLRECLARGVGFHHAGLLPQLKTIVEDLFSIGLIKILYATETFAVGINMPAKVVCVDSLQKYDGRTFRFLRSQEYFQMAGRAGRRGIDQYGKSIVVVDRANFEGEAFKKVTSKESEPIISQFRLTYNTVLNLVSKYPIERINTILRSNFGYFQKRTTGESVIASFQKKKRILTKLQYLEGEKLTAKGRFATKIFSNEILFTEIFGTDLCKAFNHYEILLIVATILYEPRRGDEFVPGKNTLYENIIKCLKKNTFLAKIFPFPVLQQLSNFINEWFNGCQFIDLMKQTNLLEGDIIRLFRQMIDVMNQIREASEESELHTKLEDCKRALNREFVEVVFD